MCECNSIFVISLGLGFVNVRHHPVLFFSCILHFQILPLNIVNATNYFGRIVNKEMDQYTILAKEMKEYFEKPNNKISATTVQKLGFYGLCEEASFHR